MYDKSKSLETDFWTFQIKGKIYFVRSFERKKESNKANRQNLLIYAFAVDNDDVFVVIERRQID